MRNLGFLNASHTATVLAHMLQTGTSPFKVSATYSVDEHLTGIIECFIVGAHGQGADGRRLTDGWIRVLADKIVPRVRCAVFRFDVICETTRIDELACLGDIDASGAAISASAASEQCSRYGQTHRYDKSFWCRDKRSVGVSWS